MRGRHKKEAELALIKVVEEYLKKLPRGKISVVLVFDRTSIHLVKEIERPFSSKSLLKVCPAGKFGNSDDALVHWAGEMDSLQVKKVLWITEDRELRFRLTEKGAE